MVIISSGSQRFDVYGGPFTKNDQLAVSPFLNGFQYIPDIPLRYANEVLALLNQPASVSRRDGGMSELDKELYASGDVEMVYRRWLEEMGTTGEEELKRRGIENAKNYTLGYVTKDVSWLFLYLRLALITLPTYQACPGIGDDIQHTPLPFYTIPDYVASPAPSVPDDTPIDFVFVDFNAMTMVQALNKVQNVTKYTTDQAKTYSPVYTNQVLGIYAQQYWN